MKYLYYTVVIFFISNNLFSQETVDSLFTQKIEEDILVDSTANQKFDYHFFQAEKHKIYNQNDSAIAEYKKCLEIDNTNSAVWFNLANLMSKDFDKHFEYIKNAVKYDKNNDLSQKYLADCYIYTNEYKKAIKIIENLYKKNRNQSKYLYELLNLYKITRQSKKYLNTINRIETLNGMSDETTTLKVNYFIEKNNLKKAIKEIDKLQKRYPDNLKYKVLKSYYYFTINDTATALEEVNKVLKNNPDNGYAYLMLYDYYKEQKNDVQLEVCINKIITDSEINIDSKIDLFADYARYIENSDYKKVNNFFIRLIEEYPKESTIYSLYAEYLLKYKKYDVAEDNLNTAILLNPEDNNNWIMLSEIYIKNDSIDKLVELSNEAEIIFPDDYSWAYYKITALFTKNKEAEAIKLIDSYIEKIDNNSGNGRKFKSLILGFKGDYLMQDSLYTDAFDCYEQSVQYNNNNILVLNNYAYFLSECNMELNKAENMSRKALDQDPNNSVYLDTYAWILFKQGLIRDAKFQIERAILYNNENPNIIEHYGDILFHSGDKEKALIQWKKSQEKGNNSDTLKEKIETQSYISKEIKCK